MDFMVDKENDVFPVEINPRFQNSTSLANILDYGRDSGEYALFLLHIAEFFKRYRPCRSGVY